MTTAVEAAKKERGHAEDLPKEHTLKYANLEKLAVASSGEAFGRFSSFSNPRACRVPEHVESPNTFLLTYFIVFFLQRGYWGYGPMTWTASPRRNAFSG